MRGSCAPSVLQTGSAKSIVSLCAPRVTFGVYNTICGKRQRRSTECSGGTLSIIGPLFSQPPHSQSLGPNETSTKLQSSLFFYSSSVFYFLKETGNRRRFFVRTIGQIRFIGVGYTWPQEAFRHALMHHRRNLRQSLRRNLQRSLQRNLQRNLNESF